MKSYPNWVAFFISKKVINDRQAGKIKDVAIFAAIRSEESEKFDVRDD
ncbi:hypothetical protein [Bacillus rubiinfantis]|nr:hypothetical protein [Bacillus rubiinfantis]